MALGHHSTLTLEAAWRCDEQPVNSPVWGELNLRHIPGVGIDFYNLYLTALLPLFHTVYQGLSATCIPGLTLLL